MDIPELKLTEAFCSLWKVVKKLQVRLFDCMLKNTSLKPAKQRLHGARTAIKTSNSILKAGAFIPSQQHLPLIDRSLQRIRK